MLSFFKCATATHVSIISEQWGHVYPLFLFVVYNFHHASGKPGRAAPRTKDHITSMIDLMGVMGVCPLHIIPKSCSIVQQASIIAKIFSGISSKTAIKCIILFL
jgi:hypothetical protein